MTIGPKPRATSLPIAPGVSGTSNTSAPGVVSGPAARHDVYAAHAQDAAVPPSQDPERTQRTLVASEALFTAMHGGVWGAGTAESALFLALEGVTPSDLALVRAHYKAHYGRDLDRDIRGELSGTDLKRATALLLGQALQADAVALREALRGLKKDSGTVFQVLERAAQSGQMEKLKATFEEQSGHPLRDRLDQALHGPRRERALALVDGNAGTAEVHALRSLLGAGASKVQDGALLGLLGKGGADLSRRFHAVTGQSLDKALDALASPLLAAQCKAALAGDDVTLRAVGLRRVLTGDSRFPPTDALAALLSGTSAKERADTLATYRTLYGNDAAADATHLAADPARAFQQLAEQGALSLATELHNARKDPDLLLALLQDASPQDVSAAQAEHLKAYGSPLDSTLTAGLDGLQGLRVRQALQGPPANLEDAVARLREQRDLLRAGFRNAASTAVMDWVLLSRKGHRLDESVTRAEGALEAARADGVITPEEHADITALINYGAADADSHADAVHRVTRVTTGVAGTLASTAALALTGGAGTPLALQIAAASLAGGTASAATAAAVGGRLYTLHRLREEFGLGALNGAASVLGQAAVTQLNSAVANAIADKVFGATISPTAADVHTQLARHLAADFALNSNDAFQFLYRVGQGAVRSGVSGGVVRGVTTAANSDTWSQGTGLGLKKLLDGTLKGAAQGAFNGSAAALFSMAIAGVDRVSLLTDAEARAVTHTVSVTTPSGVKDVLILGQLDPARLKHLQESLQKLSNVTQGHGVEGLEQVHVFELGGHSAGMCMGPNGFAVAPDLSFEKLAQTAWHESGHRMQGQLTTLLKTLTHEHPFGKGPYVSDYARTNLYEDLAETHEAFIESLLKDGAVDLNPATQPLAAKFQWLLDNMYPELK